MAKINNFKTSLLDTLDGVFSAFNANNLSKAELKASSKRKPGNTVANHNCISILKLFGPVNKSEKLLHYNS